jgi:hypothetical protein
MATAEQVITTYLNTRDYVDQAQKDLDQKLAPYKERLAEMERWLFAKLDSEGLQNFSAKGVGVAFKKKAVTVTVADWGATLPFIQSNGLWDMLNRAVNKTAVEAYVEEHKVVPPGVNYSAILKLHVQRARAA